MKREGRILVLILCLMALTAGGVHVVAQEKPDAEAKRLVEAEQRKAKRAIDVEHTKAKRAAAAERRQVKRAIDAEQSKTKQAVRAEQLKVRRATVAKRREIPLDGTFKLLSSKLSAHSKLVKGAPYSAIAVTESTHTLSDGNQINQRDEVTYFRDSEGRTRIEQTLKKIGKWVAADGPKRIIMIADPVAGHSYYLDANERKATKAALFRRVVDPAERLRQIETQKLALEKRRQESEERRAKQKQHFEEQWDKQRRLLEERAKAGQESQEDLAKQKQKFEEKRAKQKQLFEERELNQKRRLDEQFARNKQGLLSKANPEKPLTAPGPSSLVQKQTVAPADSVKGKKTEFLGKQLVEGVEAEGTRTTLIIPAGEIGNIRPIHVVDERWYSRELQTPVMTRHHDPRSGETVFRLRNINRAEPARSLFEVPADYTIVENPRVKTGGPGVPKPAALKIDTKPTQSDPTQPQKPSKPVKPASPKSQ